MLSTTMNNAFSFSRPTVKSSGVPSVPPKEPTEASIGRAISSTHSSVDKSKTDVDDDCKATYRDFSHIEAPTTTTAPPNITFPMKLHQILSSPHFSNIISWLPHGRAWKILDQKVFQEQVLPLFFKTGCYPTFCRQVNGWGFRRISDGRGAKSYYHELFLRGMPHLAEKMRRVDSKDARQSHHDERVPDLDAISRVKPLPRDPTPPPSSNSSNMDAFSPSLSDEEAHFLARRRSQMIDRATQVASTRRDIPLLPANGRDIDAYLASLTDEEALLLARRREQELRELSSTLRVLRQAREAPTRAPPAPADISVAFQNELGSGTSTTTLTGEEKLLLATHRARKLAATSSTNKAAPSPQRTQVQHGIATSSNKSVDKNPLLAALLARPLQNTSSNQGRHLANSQSTQAAPRGNPLVAALLARRVNHARQINNSWRSQIENTPQVPARQTQTIASSLGNVRRQNVDFMTTNVDPFTQRSAHGTKGQADFFASAIRNDARRIPTDTTSTHSEDSEAAIMSRARQVQVHSELLNSSGWRRDSISVVRAALDTMHRAESLANSRQREQQSNPTSQVREAPVAVAQRSEMESHSQTNATLNETRKSIAEIRESLLEGSNDASSVLDVAKFLVMNKEGRS